jgi:Fe-S cluster assembly protein SufD
MTLTPVSSIDELTAQGAAAFARSGFPTRKHEAWRHTSTKGYARFGEGALGPVNAELLEAAAVRLTAMSPAPEGGARFVFVSGIPAPSLSSGSLPAGVSMSPLGETSLEGLGAVARADEDPFVALNTLHLGQGLVFDVERGATPEVAIEIVHIAVAGESPAHPRILIRAAALSQSTFVERFVSLDEGPSMTNAVTEVVATGGAHVRHAQLLTPNSQAHHKGHVAVQVGRDAHFMSHVLSLGGAVTRTDLGIRLAEPGASCSLDGLYLARGEEQLDHYVQMEHVAPHTTSEAFYKGVADEKGVGGFVGRVLIHAGANGSSSEQLNNNLLLSADAFAHTRPQLEIDNDDVKASHGSTVGQLDPDALFYMESRGIPARTARAMLTLAFAEEMIHRLPLDYLRKPLESFVSARLSGAADASILEAFHEDL